MRVDTYEKCRTVKPRAFWVRLATSVIPVACVYTLFALNYIKAVRAFSPSHAWQFFFTLAYTAAFAGVISGLAYTLKQWCWDAVYIIVGSVRFSGEPGTMIPAGVRLRTSAGRGFSDGKEMESLEQEYITTQDTKVGADRIADVEVCVRWRERSSHSS